MDDDVFLVSWYCYIASQDIAHESIVRAHCVPYSRTVCENTQAISTTCQRPPFSCH
jgi:hypothetical protein